MRLDEIPSGLRYEYGKICDCGRAYSVLTQKNDFAEYETEIYLLCSCGEYVEFILPVN